MKLVSMFNPKIHGGPVSHMGGRVEEDEYCYTDTLFIRPLPPVTSRRLT